MTDKTLDSQRYNINPTPTSCRGGLPPGRGKAIPKPLQRVFMLALVNLKAFPQLVCEAAHATDGHVRQVRLKSLPQVQSAVGLQAQKGPAPAAYLSRDNCTKRHCQLQAPLPKMSIASVAQH